jgi:hypothetical protein
MVLNLGWTPRPEGGSRRADERGLFPVHFDEPGECGRRGSRVARPAKDDVGGHGHLRGGPAAQGVERPLPCAGTAGEESQGRPEATRPVVAQGGPLLRRSPGSRDGDRHRLPSWARDNVPHVYKGGPLTAWSPGNRRLAVARVLLGRLEASTA